MDNFTNWPEFTVSTGYDAAATSIVLTADPGAKCPVAPANAVWWDSTTHPRPQDDPNAEIVRVTARAAATLTISRAQEGTVATTKNTSGKVYKLAFCVTAKTLNTDIAADIAASAAKVSTVLVQQADQSVVSSTTLVNATDLVFPMAANTTYLFRAELQFNEAGTVAGIRLGMAGPASPTHLIVHCQVSTASTTAAFQSANAYGVVVLATIGTTGLKTATLWGTVVNGANAGNLSLQFAQTTSDANAVTIKAGSALIVHTK